MNLIKQSLKVITLLLLVIMAMGSSVGWTAHAFAQFGEPKYPADFRHFDYVNPDAPQGGTLTLSITAQNSSFDKFNPFSLKGRQAPGVQELMFETLTINSWDEVNTQYGLLADDIAVSPDLSSVTFRINKDARFSNGDPVTAQDVKYSFQTLTSKEASPRFKAYFSEISKVEVLDRLSIRFDFKRKGRDISFIAGSLPVFSAKWGVGEDGRKVDFDKLKFEEPITSGIYLIEKAASGRGITFKRNPDYWGKHIPTRQGAFNFERVNFKLYKDKDTQVAAIRSGDFDFLSEPHMRYWCCQYIGKRFDKGEILKEVVPHSNPPAINGWVVNMRQERFQDRRVRLALNYALDFEFINQKIFDSEFKRQYSFFSHTDLTAEGLPSAAELKLLEPLRDELPPEVFGPPFVQPSTKAPGSIRQNLTRALELFAEAGWHNRDGVLRNDKGEPFVIEFATGRGQSPFMDPIYLNLSKLGIIVRKKVMDPATTRSKLKNFEFDHASFALRDSLIPGPELWRAFNSKDADTPGSENLAGVKSRAVDILLNKLLDANTQEEQQTAARALDRVLIHSHYVIPWRYLTDHYVMYKHYLGRPAVKPLYFGAQDWVLTYWWDDRLNRKPLTKNLAQHHQPHGAAGHSRTAE